MLDFPASPMMARDLTLIFLHVPNNVHWQIFFHIFSLLSFSCSTYTFDPRGPEVFFLLHMLWMLCISLLGESGSRVALKQLYRDSEDHLFEEDIACHLSSDPLSKDSHNYCVPLLDILYPILRTTTCIFKYLSCPSCVRLICPSLIPLVKQLSVFVNFSR